MKLKFIYVVAFSLTALAHAGPKSHISHQPVCDDAAAAVPAAKPLLAAVNRLGGGNCPDVSKLSGICLDVYGRTKDNTNLEEYAYTYEKKIYEAACVDFKVDNMNTAKTKIQTLWNQHQDKLKCNMDNFSVANGSVLKYAVEMRAYNLVDNAINAWGVNLNVIDADDHTLLDFVTLKRDQNLGTELEPILNGYIKQLRNHGAKLRRELIQVNRT